MTKKIIALPNSAYNSDGTLKIGLDAMLKSWGRSASDTEFIPVTPFNTVSNLTSAPYSPTSILASSGTTDAVKTAVPGDILFDDDSVPIELMADLIFENIGGQELINIARNDTVNGQSVSYQIIKNLSDVSQQYNSNNIVGLQSTSDKYFNSFSIKIDRKIPIEPTGPNGSYVYLDNNTGDIIVEAVNLEADEQIEIQIVLNGTIYEAQLGAEIS
jgi:hypothetical protein